MIVFAEYLCFEENMKTLYTYFSLLYNFLSVDTKLVLVDNSSLSCSEQNMNIGLYCYIYYKIIVENFEIKTFFGEELNKNVGFC